jgi:hypothetical protein
MKKSILKTVRIVAFTVAISLTSCNNSTTTETVKETEPVVELKITTPQPSPLGMVSQRVGLTDVAIEYSRPGVKGRTIFGDLVAFGKTWRTGANSNTKAIAEPLIPIKALNLSSSRTKALPNFSAICIAVCTSASPVELEAQIAVTDLLHLAAKLGMNLTILLLSNSFAKVEVLIPAAIEINKGSL